MRQTAILHFRRRACWRFFHPEKSYGLGRVWTRELGYQRGFSINYYSFHSPLYYYFRSGARSLPWFMRLPSGLVPRRPKFDCKSVYMGFLAHIVAIEQVRLRVIRFSAATVTLAIHSTHSPIYYQSIINFKLGTCKMTHVTKRLCRTTRHINR